MKFELTYNETQAAKDFMNNHKDCCKDILGKSFYSTTGGFSFIITPTGLGNLVSIKCNSCNEILEITDSSNW